MEGSLVYCRWLPVEKSGKMMVISLEEGGTVESGM